MASPTSSLSPLSAGIQHYQQFEQYWTADQNRQIQGRLLMKWFNSTTRFTRISVESRTNSNANWESTPPGHDQGTRLQTSRDLFQLQQPKKNAEVASTKKEFLNVSALRLGLLPEMHRGQKTPLGWGTFGRVGFPEGVVGIVHIPARGSFGFIQLNIRRLFGQRGWRENCDKGGRIYTEGSEVEQSSEWYSVRQAAQGGLQEETVIN